ncbi:TrbG/VirB9 family P-type conjugative transfer protein [uncultured Phenylobacterium sp.]|uniref:TrbG/VirB9 family P-type conjugative transfer protein n=1 Tax=uncultured Phenylobacterium sp. TaxID=349273 RepID=UPI0025D48EA3|nr:TrbG/VirB9 family P-type conjugative transfer protein [uncultured Phenylobacterium sp.]
MPSAVASDGVRTFLSFPPGVIAAEAPALFALSPSGNPQLVNYRQQGALWSSTACSPPPSAA